MSVGEIHLFYNETGFITILVKQPLFFDLPFSLSNQSTPLDVCHRKPIHCDSPKIAFPKQFKK